MLITESGQGVIVDTMGNVVVGRRDFPAINAGNVHGPKILRMRFTTRMEIPSTEVHRRA